MDQTLRGAQVVDGTGAPARRADVRVRDGRLVDVGDIPAGGSEQTIDLSGLVLAPGFIDPHTHYDAQAFWDAVPVPAQAPGMLLRGGST